MQEQLTRRLNELKNEFASGQKMLIEMQAKQASLEQTLLRISGAIQVLEEELARANGQPEASNLSDVGEKSADESAKSG